MKVFIIMSLFSFSTLGYSNPGVNENTDLGARKVESHNQVTRCEGETCTINSVTQFSKKEEGKKIYRGDCIFNEVDGKRISQCETTPGLKKKTTVKVITKEKVVVKERVIDKTKSNRLQLHVGYGPTGLEVNEYDNDTSVKEKRKGVVGLQYTRTLNEDFNVGISGFSNKMVTVTAGFDF